ncbi:MAG: N-acetylmuramoyl-L-alanine amidase [candidate division WOR-3 bacterium]
MVDDLRFTLCFILFLILISPLNSASEYTQIDDLNPVFEEVSREFDVPVNILKAIGYIESHWQMRDGAPSRFYSYGIIGLREKGPGGEDNDENIGLAARLLDEPVERLKNDARTNIRAGAALLKYYARKEKILPRRLEDWAPAIRMFAPAQAVADRYTMAVYKIIAEGRDEVFDNGTVIKISSQPVDFRLVDTGTTIGLTSPDYPPALWDPAHSNNYTVSNRPSSYPIQYFIIHTMQGTYRGCIAWFKNPSAGVSAHYVMQSSDGEITQMVRNKDIAHHAGNWWYNCRSLGTEHEGWVEQWGWYTDTLYSASAYLVRYMCDLYHIPISRTYIIGHSEVPGSSHTDPGPYWDWRFFMNLVAGRPPTDTLVDDFCLGFSKGGPIAYWRFDSTGYNGHIFYTYTTAGRDTNFAIWRPNLRLSGNYDLWTFIPARSGDAVAIYRIYHRNGVTRRNIDQAANRNRWVLLGSYQFDAGSNHYVYLGDSSSSPARTRIGFDAMVWRYTGPGINDVVNRPTLAKFELLVRENPVGPMLNLKFSIPSPGRVRLRIYDETGRTIAEPVNGRYENGEMSIAIPPKKLGLNPGVYFVELIFEGAGEKLRATRKVVRLQN